MIKSVSSNLLELFLLNVIYLNLTKLSYVLFIKIKLFLVKLHNLLLRFIEMTFFKRL